jgi:hypothetical protein
MNSLILALSGASYSGKTTKMKELKSIYQDRLLLSDEVIRDKNIDIGEVRSNAKTYLDFEIEVISQKIENDKKLIVEAETNGKILLMDRSIFDSMTYFYLYGKPSDLEESDLIRFKDFDAYIYSEVIPFYNQHVNGILFFNPLKIDQERLKNDQYRQNNLVYLQNAEYNMIKTLTYGLFKNKIEEVKATTWNVKKTDLFTFEWTKL